jgi:hypothetical protein
MAVLTPFCGGILFLGSIDDLTSDRTVLGLVKMALAVFMLLSAWRWTR